jgi:hypothetical protein
MCLASLTGFFGRNAVDNRPAVVGLRDHLASMFRSHPFPVKESYAGELREHVCAVVDELKAAGWAPARIIVSVQQVATDAGMEQSFSRADGSHASNQLDVVSVSIVRWCIEQYYHVELRPT